MAAPAPDARRPSFQAFTLARVRGIPIRLHWTLVLALPFFAWLMADAYFGTDAVGWAWGAALALTLFASVTAHELAHSLVALRRGVGVREIILLPVGGASMMETQSKDHRTELLVTLAGPLSSLALGGLGLAAALALGVPLTTPRDLPAPSAFLLMAAALNVMLGLFNLLVPAFPMDGGRILRAALAGRIGMLRATKVAAAVGRFFAVLMGIAGLLGGSLLLVAIAVFVWFGARQEEQGVVLTSMLDGLRVQDVMGTTPATVDTRASVEDALQTMLASKHLALPITDAGRPIGLVTADQVARVDPTLRAATPVGDVGGHDIRTMPPDQPAPDALPTVLQAGLVAVVDAAGRLIGVVTPTDILRLVQIRSAARG